MGHHGLTRIRQIEVRSEPGVEVALICQGPNLAEVAAMDRAVMRKAAWSAKQKLSVASVEWPWSGTLRLGSLIKLGGRNSVDSNLPNSDDVRRRVVGLVTRAEAIVEAMEVAAVDGRWAMTAFSRYRVCELLEVVPYGPYDGDLEGEPAALLEEAALAVDGFDVAVEELSWRLALGDTLRTAAADIRMVWDARAISLSESAEQSRNRLTAPIRYHQSGGPELSNRWPVCGVGADWFME